MASKSSSSCTEVSASVAEFSSLEARYRSIGRQPSHLVILQLLELNQQNRRMEAELLLYLGELDRRQIYREQAVASAFEFCVLRLGYSEDVAFKRVGAARLMRRFSLIYDLLVGGRIHLSALMLLKPHLTEENHEEWLLLACEKSKRQVEKLVASRCPCPDVPTSVRKLPGARQSPLESHPQLVVTCCDEMQYVTGQASAPTAQATKAQPPSARITAARVSTEQATTARVSTEQATTAQATTAQATTAQATTAQARVAPSGQVPDAPRVAPATRVAPLSNKTYRVTFTASERLKQKLDRAGELLSHCMNPSDLPALVERALDQLLEREEKRRYGARPLSIHPSVQPECGNNSSLTGRSSSPQLDQPTGGNNLSQAVRPSNHQSVELGVELVHESCHEAHRQPSEEQDPDPAPALAPAPAGRGGSNATALVIDQLTGAAAQRTAMVKSKRRRRVPAAVRRAVFERDSGQCTFLDQQGRRCEQRHFLEFDHIDAHALGGPETASNLRLRCKGHNALEAERLFGRKQVKRAIKHARFVRLR